MKTLKQGSVGADVKTLQTLLGVVSDGIFGPKTKTAVTTFQKANNLSVDGIVGSKTWAVLLQQKEPSTEHFKMSEFKCKDGTPVPKELWKNNQTLMEYLEVLRLECGNRPVTITSGYRTKSYNKKVGGAENSQHLYAKAADIQVKGMTPAQVYKIADKVFGNGGVGKYATFVHVDIRGKRARW